jgi:hypothetical protein
MAIKLLYFVHFPLQEMATAKKKKNSNQPLVIRIIKIILIGLACAILLAAMVQKTIHYFRHHT